MNLQNNQQFELLNYTVAGKRIKQRVEEALQSGAIVKKQDEIYHYQISSANSLLFMHFKNSETVAGRKMGCTFLYDVMFDLIYKKKCIPYHCSNCYKVKIVPNNLSQLMKLKNTLERIPYTSKCGMDLFVRHNQSIYGGYIYADGLEQAYVIKSEMQPHINEINKDMDISIKRGCTEYEIALGPSDKWVVNPKLEAVEKMLRKKFSIQKKMSKKNENKNMTRTVTMFKWLQLAYQLGDETYKEFTGGKELFRRFVRY